MTDSIISLLFPSCSSVHAAIPFSTCIFKFCFIHNLSLFLLHHESVSSTVYTCMCTCSPYSSDINECQNGSGGCLLANVPLAIASLPGSPSFAHNIPIMLVHLCSCREYTITCRCSFYQNLCSCCLGTGWLPGYRLAAGIQVGCLGTGWLHGVKNSPQTKLEHCITQIIH